MSRKARDFGYGEIRMTDEKKTGGSKLPEIGGGSKRDKELLGYEEGLQQPYRHKKRKRLLRETPLSK